jgi:hypothetical protein
VNSYIVDPSVKQSLLGFQGLTEIRDTEGKVLGFFSPIDRERAAAYAEAASHFDPEEMKRRKLSNEKDYTTAEVLQHLQSLGQ